MTTASNSHRNWAASDRVDILGLRFMLVLVALPTALVIAAAGGKAAKNSATAAPPASPEATNAVGTPPGAGVAERISRQADRIGGATTSVLSASAAIGAPIVAFAALFRIAQLRRRRQLVMGDLVDGSGLPDFTGAIVGLSELAREHLAAELTKVDQRVRARLRPVGRQPKDERTSTTPGTSRGRNPSVRRSIDDSLGQLATSVATFLPEGIRPGAQLIREVLLRPKIHTISVTLQRQGASPDRLGITLDLTDLRGGDGHRSPLTVWEVAAAPTTIPADAERVPKDGAGKTEGHAHFRIGLVYERRGALTEARDAYLKALEKWPGCETAERALERVLPQIRTYEQRYRDLLPPTARLLALELSFQIELLARTRRLLLQVPIREWQKGPRAVRASLKSLRKEQEGWTRNLYGNLHVASGMAFSDDVAGFFDQGAAHLRQATELISNFYQPFENLGDAYSFQARGLSARGKAEDARKKQIEAILQYDRALERARRITDEVKGYIVQLRITVSKAISQLLVGDERLRSEAREAITRASEGDRFEQFALTKDADPRVLYNLASWYALFALDEKTMYVRRRVRTLLAYAITRQRTLYHGGRKDPDIARYVQQRARTLLAYAITRQRTLYHWARKDPDIASIRDGLDRLEFEISLVEPKLRELHGEAFRVTMAETMKRASWS
ncbi:MAG: hypothetical protein M3O70_10500 [Actinomycetota bacterium]|nr:hypothetical protein [Actinomycetota bacterium]